MVVKCPLCGYRFDSAFNKACSGCPVGAKCEKVCCPNCHYGWIESTSFTRTISGWFKKGKSVGRS